MIFELKFMQFNVVIIEQKCGLSTAQICGYFHVNKYSIYSIDLPYEI